eukprot:jgi/Tetstr1/445535/TSEL_033309.t1
MIDFACVSSTTPTWSNDPRWCIPGIAATEAEHAKLAADRASSAPVQGVHRYYPFVVEDRGRLGKSALKVVYIFAVLLAVRNFAGAEQSQEVLSHPNARPSSITHGTKQWRRCAGVVDLASRENMLTMEAAQAASEAAEPYGGAAEAESFTLSKILNKLNSCIIWTKKSSKGWHALILACREMRAWSMLRSLITARVVVDHLYGTMPQTASTNLRERQPAHAEWSVAAAMEDVLSHPCKLGVGIGTYVACDPC